MASYPSHFVLSKAVRVVRFLLVTIASVAPSLAAKEDEVIEKKPNIIVIMTDEHNLKTLGCYRDLLGDEQAYPWGPGVNMETPNMDSLASGGGAIFSNFYSVAPTCTAARGSFLTGTYSNTHGAFINDKPMHGTSISFAQVLKEKLGYHTSYIGKFHLNGSVKDPTSFGSPRNRSFGFDETKYLWNAGIGHI